MPRHGFLKQPYNDRFTIRLTVRGCVVRSIAVRDVDAASTRLLASQRLGVWPVVCSLLALPFVAQAQSVAPGPAVPAVAPSQVTPGGNRLAPIVIPSSRATRLDMAVAPLEAPPGAEHLPVAVRDLEVTGSFPALAQAHAAFQREVVDRALSLAEVYAAAGRLEGAYARAGFVLVRIAIPPQRVEQGGTLHVDVIDGTIEQIDAAGISQHARDRIRAHLAPLIGQPHLRLPEIERRLTLAGATPGLTLRSTLKTGTGPGTTRLVVEAQMDYASFSLAADNSLPASLGSHMVTASATLNNLAGLGEQITLATGQSARLGRLGSPSSPYSMESIALALPLGVTGLSLTASHVQARTLQSVEPAYLNALGHFSRTGASLNAALVAGHDAGLVLSVGEDTVVQAQALPFFGLVLNRDDYTSLRLGLGGWRRFADGSYAAGELRLSRGLGGRTGADVAYSQPGAHNDYTSLSARLSWRANLGGKTNMTLTANGQLSFGEALFVPEKFALSALDGISATVPGQLIADSGLTIRDELVRAITIAGPGGPITIGPYVFSAIGFGWAEQAGGAARGFDVQSLGAGIRGSAAIGRGRASFSLEYDRCLCPAAIGSGRDRLNFALGIGF